MNKEPQKNKYMNRRNLLRSFGLVASTAFVGTATASGQKDERQAIDEVFAQLLEKHGQPKMTGKKAFGDAKAESNSFGNENVIADDGLENARDLFSNKPFDLVGAMKYRFEDGTKKTVALGTNPGDKLMVYVNGRYYTTQFTNDDRKALAKSREQLNSGMEQQIQSALRERYQSDQYQEVAK